MPLSIQQSGPPNIEKAPAHLRGHIKRLVHVKKPVALGYFIDVNSKEQPILIAGRTPMSYLLFRQLIRQPSLTSLKRNVALLWVDVLDQMEDQMSFKNALGAKDGFHLVHSLMFYRSHLNESVRLRSHCRKVYIRSLRMLVDQGRH